MPPATAKASANCCIGREPPSPDGLAPRPALSAGISSSKGIPVEHGRSWTSADVNELQAIFEDEIRADTKTDSIKLNKFRGDVDEDLDSEQSEFEMDQEQIRPMKSSHTLKIVAEKLKKHLSIDSALAKRHSRSSIGTTDEELDRRAELRRIRQRRIQEELSNESIYDDDAKSLSFPLSTTSGGDRKTPVPQLSNHIIPLADLTPKKLSHPVPVLPELRLDATGETNSPAVKSPETVADSVDMSMTLLNSNESVERSHSPRVLSTLDVNEHEAKVYGPSRTSSSVLETPAAPTLPATRLPSIADPDNLKSPWRLSFSSVHRGEGLRKLSHGNAAPDTVNTEKLTTASSATSIRTCSSGLNRCAANSTVNSETNNDLATTGSHSRNCCSSADFGGVDGGADSTAPHLHEMDISQRLVSKGLQSSISSPQLSSWGSHQRGNSTSRGKVTGDQTRRMRHTEDFVASIDGSLKIWSEIKLDTSPLRSKSTAATTHPPVENSRFKLLSFLPKTRTRTKSKTNVVVVGNEEGPEVQQDIEEHKISTDLPGLTTIVSSASSPESGSARPIDIMSLSPGRLAYDDTSVVPSEASSFLQREEELSNLQLRFTERRVVSTPVSSKFREEFDKPAPPPLPTRKPSVLERLAKLARRSYDGTIDGTVDRSDLLSIPIPEFDPATLLNSPNIKSPLVNDDAEAFWSGAAKGNKGKEVEKDGKKSKFGRKKSIAGGDKKKFVLFGKKKKGAELSAAEQYQKQFDERMAVKEFVMDSWEMELEATAAKAKTKSRNIVKKTNPTAPDYRFPASWARFPSHDRHERVESASVRDKVDIRDFAKLGAKDNGDVLWCLAHDDAGHHTTTDELHRKKGVGERFIEKIEKELYEFDTQDDQRSQASGRRGSLTVACELEYPELEILPVTLMDKEEMQKHEEKKEEFENAAAKDEELDEIAKLLGGGFDGVMSEVRDAGARFSAGASDWEDEMVMSSSDERESRPHIGISDPTYYADCVVVTKSTFASAMASPVGTPGGTLALRTDVLEELLRIPGVELTGGEALARKWKGRGREQYRRTWSGEDWDECMPGYDDGEGVGAGISTGTGTGKERKRSLGTLLLSKSVCENELVGELVRREVEERDSLLRAVEDAFGKGAE